MIRHKILDVWVNVLKYIKHNKDKFPYVYRGIESIY